MHEPTHTKRRIREKKMKRIQNGKRTSQNNDFWEKKIHGIEKIIIIKKECIYILPKKKHIPEQKVYGKRFFISRAQVIYKCHSYATTIIRIKIIFILFYNFFSSSIIRYYSCLVLLFDSCFLVEMIFFL